jgi:predicted GNAT superfamily acetyltransferase
MEHRLAFKEIRISIAEKSRLVHLRRLEGIEEYRQCEALQARIWGSDDVGSVSPLVMITAQESGGIVLGAFVEKKLVGFVCSFPGYTEDGIPKQCSVLLAVEPEFRSTGLGLHLKLLQREETLAQGLDLITWTFDPLACVNASLNIKKLGCVVSRYLHNIYGSFTGGLNAGMNTDRFLAEWWIREPWVEDCLLGVSPPAPDRAELVNEVVLHPALEMPMIRSCDLGRRGPALLVEIPPDIQAVKKADMGLARAWSAQFREIFPHYFSLGYRVCGLVPLAEGDRPRRAYVLRQHKESGMEAARPRREVDGHRLAHPML